MNKIIDQGSEWIDPVNCDSMVSYKVGTEQYDKGMQVDGVIQLEDCTHKITWQFYGSTSEAEKLAKVDRAIDVLRRFRRAVRTAYKVNKGCILSPKTN